MAIESYYLRNKIKYHIARLKKHMLLGEDDIPDDKINQYSSNVEIHIIQIATLTRKLRDLGKLPDDTLENTVVKLERFKSHGPDSQRAYVSMEKEYDLTRPIADHLPLSRIIDLIIHSYVLQATGDENYSFACIFVTSDHTQFKGLYSIKFSTFIEACLKAANAYPSSLRAVYDEEKQKWIHTRS